MGSFFLLIFSSLLVLSDAATTVCNDPTLFVFGDSNSDTGGYNAAFGGISQYPFGNTLPRPLSERASDGRLIIDFLCENVNTTYLQAFLNALEPSYPNGANFAVAGASTQSEPYKLDTQVKQFMRFQNRSVDLHSKGSKQELVGEEAFKRALYVIDIGQNDLAMKFHNNGTYDAMIEIIPNIIAEIKKAVQNIYDNGGRKFWIHNTGPLGCLPYEISLGKHKSTDLDQHGCIKYVNEAAQVYNKDLSTLCEEMRNEKKDATIVYVDMYTIKYDLIASASQYGFENPLIGCYDKNAATGPSNPCADQSKYISWDWVHYTDAANAIFASKIISTNYSTPQLPFNFFCDGSVN